MPYLDRENLFIGNIGDAAEILQNGPVQNQHHVAHILSVLSSASISFFSEWRTGLSIPTKEITKVYVGDLAAGTAGPDLKLVRMAVPLRDTENENLLDYLEVCIDYIDRSRKEGSVLLDYCFAGVSRRVLLVARLCASVEGDKLLVRLGLERGTERFPIEQVVKQLCKSYGSFLQQLEDLEEHISLCFYTVNRGRTLLLQEICSSSP